MTAADLGTPMLMLAWGADAFYTGLTTDLAGPFVVAPDAERFVGLIGTADGDIPANTSAVLSIGDYGAMVSNPSETGLLLVTNASRSDSQDMMYHGGAPNGKESITVDVVAPPAP